MNKTLIQPLLRSNSHCRNPTSIEKKKTSSLNTHTLQELCFTPVTHTHIDLLGAFRSDNISQATSHVAVKAPIKSAWCCKSLEWFGACKPLESHGPPRAKSGAGAWRGGGRGYMVGLAFYLMHHLPLRCCLNWQRSSNEATMVLFSLFFLILTQSDHLRGRDEYDVLITPWKWEKQKRRNALGLIEVAFHL